ncbi:hypothetical protein HX057_14915 [Myroides odoratimimus]|uniref:Uncharacterized protein n=1 Tax=Myroides odoratimimus CIP 101113 TaxID=883154 RepID=A0AAV3F326_9FLAO|nr:MULTISPECIES: hypothetical protein [Myroides]EHO11815.1 hypothetical protein HMPREF9715_01909 [Myroides odoratimimus CIP 101113]EKB06797.1 hypothetical protein HMPREF9711_00579 [Myroides odoratimimus CCUG 3837]MDM1092980.1 hypothetical protein [Myroides odoratimimus]MDM1415232.1 hypothetical protein [Myroides odoratimimus]MDM1448035.1 hypothetical protein [Myroides odoratimimus]
MKKYSRFNFFKHTYCEWQEIPMSFIEGRKPDYKSKTGSMYYYDEKGVARYANHWGRAANCRWKITSDEYKNSVYTLAYATWDSFFPNNEQEPLYAIIIDEEKKYVTFKHKGCLNDTNHVLRSASETAKRITKIKEILETDGWYKYLDFINIEEARTFLINGLVNSNIEFLKLKQELLKKQ